MQDFNDTPFFTKNIHEQGIKFRPDYESTLKKLNKIRPEQADRLVHEAHAEAIENIDCLSCANCCKTTSPAIYERDIDRLAKRLRMKPSQFIDKYLDKDQVDHCYVLKSSPCVFLDAENYCTVYDDRPTACRTYPHTDRKRVTQINKVTLNNTLICPAVQHILEKVAQKLNK
ncbi:MAG: YkgJ family cysteine cluster protein [Flavobacteriales bacterium]